MNQLQQEDLFMKNADIVDSERIKVQQLEGKFSHRSLSVPLPRSSAENMMSQHLIW